MQAFLAAQGQPKGAAHKTMHANVDPAVTRFETQLAEEDQADLRDALKAYTRAYAFLGQVVPFTDPDLESLFYYAKLLLDRLPDDGTERGAIDLGDTTLQFIGHEAGVISSGPVQATDSERADRDLRRGGPGWGAGPGAGPPVRDHPHLQRHARHRPQRSRRPAAVRRAALPHGRRSARAELAADNSEEQFGLTVRKDNVAGAIFDRQEASDRLFKLSTEDANFAGEVAKYIWSATYQAARARGGSAPSWPEPERPPQRGRLGGDESHGLAHETFPSASRVKLARSPCQDVPDWTRVSGFAVRRGRFVMRAFTRPE